MADRTDFSRIESIGLRRGRQPLRPAEAILFPDEIGVGSARVQPELSDADGQAGPSNRLAYTVIFVGVSTFFLITYPYREIRLPSILLALLGMITVVGLLAASWFRPQYYWASIAFCIYIPFSAEYPGDFGRAHLGINFTNILLFPVLIQWFMQRSHMNRPLVRFHSPDVPLLAFCLLSSISLMRGATVQGDAYFALYVTHLKRWLFPFLVYFVFVNTARNERGVRFVVVAICMTLTAVAILTMKESFDIGPGGSWDKIRVKGILGQPNATGAFFVYYTLIFFGFFLCNWRSRRYWLLLIPFALCGRALTLANSRGGLIAFTIAVLATLWFRSKWLFLVGLTAIVASVYFPQYLPETISGRLLFGTLREASDDGTQADEPLVQRLDNSAQGRVAIWMAGVEMVKDRPWFGFGYRQFPYRVGDYNHMVAARDPHNTYLGVAAEMGVLALGFFLLTLLLILRSCLFVYKHAPDVFMRSVGLAGVGMSMGVASANFFGSQFETTELTAYFWILSAVIVQYEAVLRGKVREIRALTRHVVADPWVHEEEEA
ncbi:O-antigen ligase family protein [Candidatus Sumerlaeota bacterium]|nr:O-antigen ligase family protein [Candidatus Sumerlaeota bacterium]